MQSNFHSRPDAEKRHQFPFEFTAIAPGLCTRCPARRMISKTPRVTNVDLFHRFFPDSSLLILVRDGRAIVESGARTFHWSREAAHFRYNAIAGPALAPFGYREHVIDGVSLLPAIRNMILDVAWWLRVLIRPVYHRMQLRRPSVFQR